MSNLIDLDFHRFNYVTVCLLVHLSIFSVFHGHVADPSVRSRVNSVAVEYLDGLSDASGMPCYKPYRNCCECVSH